MVTKDTLKIRDRVYLVEWVDRNDQVYPVPQVRPYEVVGRGELWVTLSLIHLGRLAGQHGRKSRYKWHVLTAHFRESPLEAIKLAQERELAAIESAARQASDAERKQTALDLLRKNHETPTT